MQIHKKQMHSQTTMSDLSAWMKQALDHGATNNTETPLTLRYWMAIGGGTLCFEYPIVRFGPTNERRYLDGLICPNGPTEIVNWSDFSIPGKDLLAIQTKRGRLGMYLIGASSF